MRKAIAQLQTGQPPGSSLVEGLTALLERCRKCEEDGQKASQAFQELLLSHNALSTKKWEAMLRTGAGGTAEGLPGSGTQLNSLDIVKELEFKDRIIVECDLNRPEAT